MGGGWRTFLTGLCKQTLSRMGWTQLPRALMGETSVAPMWTESALTQGYLPYPDMSPALPAKSISLHSFCGGLQAGARAGIELPPTLLHTCSKSFSLPDAGYSEAPEFHQCRSQQRLQGRWRCLKCRLYIVRLFSRLKYSPFLIFLVSFHYPWYSKNRRISVMHSDTKIIMKLWIHLLLSSSSSAECPPNVLRS